MADNERVICRSDDLQERGQGVRFQLPELGEHITGFVIRFEGRVHAYVNQCAHVSVELDWNEGDFFNITKDYLICATHGAHYQPDNGYCVMGPCKGQRLKAIDVFERNQQVMINLDSINKENQHHV
jgi:nitrite reductase/ring-hydroxylating ferredoxin subunit